jgi:preprotein translocase subunit SecA
VGASASNTADGNPGEFLGQCSLPGENAVDQVQTFIENENGATQQDSHRGSSNRLGPRWRHHLQACVGLPWQRLYSRAVLQVPRIRAWEAKFRSMSDGELTRLALQLRGRARSGESLDRLLPETFGLTTVAISRFLKLNPHDVQLVAGVVLHYGGLVEMATGEGKTLVACFPVALNGLTGKGVHVATVNQYLADRDAQWLRPVYERLGLTVGTISSQMSDPDRAAAYRCDITYGVASNFGFDFLRDRLKVVRNETEEFRFWTPWTSSGAYAGSLDPKVQRGHQFALVDEADNIFIDEARTPLVISTAGREASEEEAAPFLWANEVAKKMQPGIDFVMHERFPKLEVTKQGLALMRWSSPPTGPEARGMSHLFKKLEKALHAHYRLVRDRDYVVVEDKVVIIDESTGRSMPDRSWGEGLHQAVQAKEGVAVGKGSDHAAQITFQSYFRFYHKLAGMTGTAAQNWWELWRVYGLWVVPVPTNRLVCRQHLPDRVFPTEDAKFTAVVEEVTRFNAQGRPVLIGTKSVESSEKLSRWFQDAGIEHQVLNARYHEQEAEIVAQAGQAGRVTIATNMAGRGTDIKLGPGVAELGGLHVLGTERHESLRIDRQLMGRSGRQGDPGSCQFVLSLEDKLLEGLGWIWYEELGKLGRKLTSANWQKFLKFFVRAQRRYEKLHYRQRMDLLHYTRNRGELMDALAADPNVD